MKKILALAVLATLGSAAAYAEEGPWMMRIRAIDTRWDHKSDAIPGVLAADKVYLENKTIPEVDFTYFFSKNLAAELILTYPQKFDVTAEGLGKVGTLKALPPTLTLQYHFMPEATFRPYVGAGINYTRLSSINLGTLDTFLQTNVCDSTTCTSSLDKNSWGAAYQLGFDIKVGANSYINVDYKKVYIKTDLKNSELGKLTTVKVDPELWSIGYGFKF